MWQTKLACGAAVTVSQNDLIPLLWYDGLVLAALRDERDTLLVAFVSESADRRHRFYFGYSVATSRLDRSSMNFLDSQSSKAAAQMMDADEYEAATKRVLGFRNKAENYFLIDADPQFRNVFRSKVVKKTIVNAFWTQLEDYYSLPDQARNRRHDELAALLDTT